MIFYTKPLVAMKFTVPCGSSQRRPQPSGKTVASDQVLTDLIFNPSGSLMCNTTHAAEKCSGNIISPVTFDSEEL